MKTKPNSQQSKRKDNLLRDVLQWRWTKMNFLPWEPSKWQRYHNDWRLKQMNFCHWFPKVSYKCERLTSVFEREKKIVSNNTNVISVILIHTGNLIDTLRFSKGSTKLNWLLDLLVIHEKPQSYISTQKKLKKFKDVCRPSNLYDQHCEWPKTNQKHIKSLSHLVTNTHP